MRIYYVHMYICTCHVLHVWMYYLCTRTNMYYLLGLQCYSTDLGVDVLRKKRCAQIHFVRVYWWCWSKLAQYNIMWYHNNCASFGPHKYSAIKRSGCWGWFKQKCAMGTWASHWRLLHCWFVGANFLIELFFEWWKETWNDLCNTRHGFVRPTPTNEVGSRGWAF